MPYLKFKGGSGTILIEKSTGLVSALAYFNHTKDKINCQINLRLTKSFFCAILKLTSLGLKMQVEKMYTNKDCLRGAIKETRDCLRAARQQCFSCLKRLDLKGAQAAAFNAKTYQQRLVQLQQEARV